MISKEFGAHGKFSIEKEGNVIVVNVEGPGNIELIEACHDKIYSVVSELNGASWGSINIFHKESFFPPDAAQELTEGARRAKLVGFVACAFIIKAEEYANSMKSFWETIYVNSGIKYRFFENETDAHVWLKEQLELHSQNA